MLIHIIEKNFYMQNNKLVKHACKSVTANELCRTQWIFASLLENPEPTPCRPVAMHSVLWPQQHLAPTHGDIFMYSEMTRIQGRLLVSPVFHFVITVMHEVSIFPKHNVENHPCLIIHVVMILFLTKKTCLFPCRLFICLHIGSMHGAYCIVRGRMILCSLGAAT